MELELVAILKNKLQAVLSAAQGTTTAGSGMEEGEKDMEITIKITVEELENLKKVQEFLNSDYETKDGTIEPWELKDVILHCMNAGLDAIMIEKGI